MFERFDNQYIAVDVQLFFRFQRQPRTMTDMQNKDVFAENDKKNAVDPAVPASVEQFPNRLMQCCGFPRKWCALRIPRQRLDFSAYSLDPGSRSFRSVLTNITVGAPQIVFRLWRNDDAKNHPSRPSRAKTSSTGRPAPRRACASPRRIAVIESNCSAIF